MEESYKRLNQLFGILNLWSWLYCQQIFNEPMKLKPEAQTIAHIIFYTKKNNLFLLAQKLEN